MELSKTLGVIFNIEVMRGGPAAQFAPQVEKLGYSALWYGEGVSGRDPFLIGACSASTSPISPTAPATGWSMPSSAGGR